ncbi:hypothetical protein, partial [Fulvivirga kasyanovii]
LVYWLPVLSLWALLPVMVVYFLIRLPVSKSIVIDSRVIYRMVDTTQGDFLRNGIEMLLGNKKVFLADPIDDLNWVYVDKTIFEKLWPESPLEMSRKNYTIKARFRTYKLLFGGYGKASVIGIEKLEENPIIRK